MSLDKILSQQNQSQYIKHIEIMYHFASRKQQSKCKIVSIRKEQLIRVARCSVIPTNILIKKKKQTFKFTKPATQQIPNYFEQI